MPVLTLPAPLPGIITTPVVPTPTPTYTALIGGTFVNVVAGSVNIQTAIGQRGTGGVSVWGPLGTYWQYGTQALIFDETGAQVFGGYVARDHAYRGAGARQGDLGYLEHDLTLMDNCYRADKRLVFKAYANVSAGTIVNDLLGSYLAAEGVVSAAGSIAEGPTIIQAIWGGSKTVSDVLSWLAQQAGYWWTIDADGVLWFQPYGGISAPFALDGTTVDSVQQLSVDYGSDLLINKQFVKGSVAQTAQLSETFKGNGNTRSFTLSYDLNTLVSATLNAVDITNQVYQKGSSGGKFYGLVGDAVIAQDPSQTLLTSGDTLVVTYVGQYPVLASAQNNALIAAQQARERVGSGLIESVYSDTKVRSLPAAFQIASGRLAHFGADTTVLSFSTREKGLQPGQLLLTSLSDFGLVNLPMLVVAVSITDQVDGQNIWYTVGAVGAIGATAWALETAQWQTFWQNLMAQSSDPSDYTDAQDTSLAQLSASVFAHTPSFAVTATKASCPIIGNSTIIGNSLIIC